MSREEETLRGATIAAEGADPEKIEENNDNVRERDPAMEAGGFLPEQGDPTGSYLPSGNRPFLWIPSKTDDLKEQ